jgi:hypothetical protein
MNLLILSDVKEELSEEWKESIVVPTYEIVIKQ